VQLLDAEGFSSALNEKITDSSGQVEFKSVTGSHKVRIFGPNIHEYAAGFQIGPNETRHEERIPVALKEATTPHLAGAPGTVPAVRLRIPSKARKRAEKAAEAFRNKRWAESRDGFQAAIDLYPEYDLAYNGLGIAASEMKDMDAARRAFAKAIELNPGYTEAQRNLARVLISQNKYDEALPLLKRSLEKEPSNAWALFNAAYAELQARKFEDALADARKVHLVPHAGLANAHMIAGYALQAMGQNDQAIEEFKLYLKEEPSGPNVKRAQGLVAELERPNKSD